MSGTLLHSVEKQMEENWKHLQCVISLHWEAKGRTLAMWVCLFVCLFVCSNRSATRDSNLFSSYFGNCPVISAKGRTFPVTTFFLENIYEQLDYRLASDSPAAFFNSSKGHSRKVCSSFQIVSNVSGYSVFTSHQTTENLKFYLWIYKGFFIPKWISLYWHAE
jgi:hypothetical protein